MKSEIYNVLAAINRSFDVTLESLTILKNEGVLTVDYVAEHTELAEELRAKINSMILNKLQFREVEDREHFGTMLRATEMRLTSEAQRKS
jgi:hypothetical protein